MMKKYWFIGLLVLAVVLVVSCAPKEASPETASDTAAEETPEEELLGEEETGALAGQAINRGCRTRKVDSCTSKDDGSIVVELKGKTKLYKANCRGSRNARNAYTYRCREGGKPGYEYCRTQCEAGEACQQGNCVVLCGNGAVDAGETCSSCAQDVVCAAGQVCNNGACEAIAIEAPQLCGNGVVDAGETCASCAEDIVCFANEQCSSSVCLLTLGEACSSNIVCASGECGMRFDPDYGPGSICEERNQPLGSPCNNETECASGLCGSTDVQQRYNVCEEPNQPPGSRCQYDSECASGICGNTLTCEELNPLGSSCRLAYGRTQECASGICGGNASRQLVCEEPNQSLGSSCSPATIGECASGVCGTDQQGRVGICVEPNQQVNLREPGPIGSSCSADRECVSGTCGINEWGRLVCVEAAQPIGARCARNSNCASGLCGDDGVNRVCEMPNQEVGSQCREDTECASGLCGWTGEPSRQHVCEEPNLFGSACLTHHECVSGVCSEYWCR